METPVKRPRGRPRKRRRREEEIENEAVKRVPIALVGRYVLKDFPGNGVFLGKVVYYECGLYRVSYEDGDCEDLDSGEVRGLLVNDADFDRDLARRRGQLEKLVTKNGGKKVEDRSKKGAAEKGMEELAAEASDLNSGGCVKNDEGGVLDDNADGGSESDSDLECRDSEIETEALLPLPPRLELPPSSGTIGVPEQSVQHLLSVYGFLRSFSIRLFLQPFTLDEFVGAINCRTANTLFDAIHVSLMRMLRRHLEASSSEGSELASKCLR